MILAFGIVRQSSQVHVTMQQHNKGLTLAIAAYTIWGFFPLYFHYLSTVSALEVLVQRIIWSFVVTLILGLAIGSGHKLIAAFKDKKQLGWLGLSALLISINWLVYIWAVGHNRIIESSLGYFITPVVSLILAKLFFKETFHPLQWWAGLIAAIAIAWEVISFGQLPWISIILAFAFAFYGVVRKHCTIDSITGMTIETLWLLVPALLWVGWQLFHSATPMAFGHLPLETALLMGLGVVSALPLVLFSMATQRIDLSVVGFIMYINPTIQFLIGVFILKEHFQTERIITFLLIWLALTLFSIGLFRLHKNKS